MMSAWRTRRARFDGWRALTTGWACGEGWGLPANGSRQERSPASPSASSQGLAAFSPAARHQLSASARSRRAECRRRRPWRDVPFDHLHRIGLPRPTARMLRDGLRIGCLCALPSPIAPRAVRSGDAQTIEQRDGIFGLGVGVSARVARQEPRRLNQSFGTPRPSLRRVASAYWASGFPSCAAARNSSAARGKSCGNDWPSR